MQMPTASIPALLLLLVAMCASQVAATPLRSNSTPAKRGSGGLIHDAAHVVITSTLKVMLYTSRC